MTQYAEQLKQMTNEELIEILSQDSPFKLTIIKAEVLSRMEPYRLARAGGHDIAEYYEENEQPSQEHLKEAYVEGYRNCDNSYMQEGMNIDGGSLQAPVEFEKWIATKALNQK